MTKNKKENEKTPEYINDPKSCYDVYDDETIEASSKFSDKYMNFLSKAKTERQTIQEWVQLLKENGFKNIEDIKNLKTWDKVYFNYRGKNLFACQIGKDLLSNGFNLIGSHVDAPRIDFKYKPFYTSNGLGLMKTQYYGGIKKYQRVATPLSIIGTIYDKDGNKKHIQIWEQQGDPNFFLSDLLPHLSKDQLQKKAKKVIEGEKMNLIIGSKHDKDESNKLKENILKIFFEKYNIREQDFMWAELQLVPSFKPKHIGIDRSMIGGYGQDDRICAYSSLRALIDMQETPRQTAIVYWSDKEEVGSIGSTGSQSNILTYFIQKLFTKTTDNFNIIDIQDCFYQSNAISSDVSAMFDPNFSEVFDKRNTAKINRGIILEKYTGRGGKYLANDADTEYVQKLKNMLENNNIPYQFGEIGKVDQWGGGTISKFLAHLGINTIDAGPGLFNMHAPLEVASKTDLYSTYQTFKNFWYID